MPRRASAKQQAYRDFVSQYITQHKGEGKPRELMSAAAAAWRSSKVQAAPSGGYVRQQPKLYHSYNAMTGGSPYF